MIYAHMDSAAETAAASGPSVPDQVHNQKDSFDDQATVLDSNVAMTRRDRKKMKRLEKHGQEATNIVEGLLGKSFCEICQKNCFSPQNLANHYAGSSHKQKAKEHAKMAAGTTRFLDRFPMKGETLNHNVFVADLNEELKNLTFNYIDYCCKGSPELVDFAKIIVEKYPKYLRVKELFETLEAYVRIGKAVACELRGIIDTIYDFACGHGLLGVLFAYRFPALKVRCVDLTKRVAFDHYVETLREVGVHHPDEGPGGIVGNLEYIESDFNKIELDEKSFVMCIHGCNEVTSGSMDMVMKANAAYGMMPCCIRDSIYTTHRLKYLKNDDTRYAIMIGMIAERYKCHRITAIDRMITNRHLVIIGPAGKFPEKSTPPGTAGGNPNV